MNLPRGLFRLWVMFAVLFIFTVAAVSSGHIRTEFKNESFQTSLAQIFPNGRKIGSTELAARIKAKYPEYANVDDDELAARFLKKYPMFRSRMESDKMPLGFVPDVPDIPAGPIFTRQDSQIIPEVPAQPWTTLIEDSGFATGVPLAVLLLGWAFIWALSGFSDTA